MDAFVALCLLTAVVSVALAVERVSTAHVTVLRWLHVVYLLATAVWSVGVLGGTGQALSWSLPARFVGAAVVVAAVYCISLALSDAAWRPRRRLLALLSIHPLVMLVAGVTSPWHHLVVGPGAAAWGPLYWVHIAVSYGLFAVAVGRVVVRRASTPMLRTRHASVLVVSWFFPIVGNIVVLVRVGPSGPDPTPVWSLATAIVVAYSISRGLERLAPIARTRIFEGLTDALLVLSPEGAVVDANPAAMALLAQSGEERGAVTGRTLGELAPGVAALVGAGDGEHTLEGSDGPQVIDVRVTVMIDASGRELGRLVVLRDVTEAAAGRQLLAEAHDALRTEAMLNERLTAELAEQTLRDPGTGLHNRRHLDVQLPWLIEHSEGRPLSVIMVDIDHFKRVNDAHGHAAGDRVLRTVAGVLDAHAQSVGGEAIRYGGEEFLVLLPGMGGADTYHLAEDMRRACGDVVVDARDGGIAVTVSAGVASWSAGHLGADDLFAAADAALYAAKCAGRNRTAVADDAVVTVAS
jgi:diguanylate cyclase (GGDEF)-like protein